MTDSQIRVVITGASGFVGRRVVQRMLTEDRYYVVATGRNERVLETLGCPYVVHDIIEPASGVFEKLCCPDILIHLAWEPLDNYRSPRHLNDTLPGHCRFLRAMIAAGLPRLCCAGTCLEYGLQAGCLAEDVTPRPTTAYGKAKDALRCFLETLQSEFRFSLLWLRLFYMHGAGQPGRTLFAQLDRAIDEGAATFAMSGGEQLRDYLRVETAAEYVVRASLQHEVEGIMNICRGEPASIRKLVEAHVRRRGRPLELQLGRIPYPDHEPHAFWGDNRRLRSALAADLPPRKYANVKESKSSPSSI